MILRSAISFPVMSKFSNLHVFANIAETKTNLLFFSLCCQRLAVHALNTCLKGKSILRCVYQPGRWFRLALPPTPHAGRHAHPRLCVYEPEAPAEIYEKDNEEEREWRSSHQGREGLHAAGGEKACSDRQRPLWASVKGCFRGFQRCTDFVLSVVRSHFPRTVFRLLTCKHNDRFNLLSRQIFTFPRRQLLLKHECPAVETATSSVHNKKTSRRTNVQETRFQTY